MISALVAASLLLAGADQAVVATTVSPAKVVPAQDPNAIVCHNETPSGSRIPQKVCRRAGDIHHATPEEVRNAVNDASDKLKSAVTSPGSLGFGRQ